MRFDVACRLHRPRSPFDVRFSCEASNVGIIGPSGAGKSTLLSILAGGIDPDEGVVRLDDEVLFDRQARTSIPPNRRRIGLVSQRNDLFPHLTVRANLDVALRFAPAGAKGADESALIAALGLEPLLSERADRLSGGEARRVQLARSLLNRPRLLLLDEPFGGLDEPLRHEVLGALLAARAASRIPFVLVTHRPAEAVALSDFVVALRAGRVAAMGDPLSVLSDPAVLGPRHLFGIETLFPAARAPGGKLFWGERELFGSANGVESEIWFALGADDVVLATSSPGITSARHVWPAHVVRIVPLGEELMIGLRVEGVPEQILARVSRQACAELCLAEGSEVCALFKAAALRRLGQHDGSSAPPRKRPQGIE